MWVYKTDERTDEQMDGHTDGRKEVYFVSEINAWLGANFNLLGANNVFLME